MFDIGFTELLVIAVVGLVVLGPKRLPEVARTAGQWLGKVRRFVADVKSDIDRELQQAELAELRNLKHELDETRRMMEQTSDRLIQQANIMPPSETSTELTSPEAPAAPNAAPTAAPPPQPAAAPAEIPLDPTLITTPPRPKRAAKPRKKPAAPKQEEHDGTG